MLHPDSRVLTAEEHECFETIQASQVRRRNIRNYLAAEGESCETGETIQVFQPSICDLRVDEV